MPKYRLAIEIIKLSRSETWDAAKLEWKLEGVYEAKEPETCLCGHFPIIEICTLRNKMNGGRAVVGNRCVKKFMGLPSDKIVQAIKRVRKDSKKSLNGEALQHAYDRGWIDNGERDSYFPLIRKRSLSPDQAAKKIQINEKILKYATAVSGDLIDKGLGADAQNGASLNRIVKGTKQNVPK